MTFDVLAGDDGNPRTDKQVKLHRAGSVDCAGRAAYDVEHPAGPDYVRADEAQLHPEQSLCRHPGCFKNETPGTTLGHLISRRPRL